MGGSASAAAENEAKEGEDAAGDNKVEPFEASPTSPNGDSVQLDNMDAADNDGGDAGNDADEEAKDGEGHEDEQHSNDDGRNTSLTPVCGRPRPSEPVPHMALDDPDRPARSLLNLGVLVPDGILVYRDSPPSQSPLAPWGDEV